MRMIAALLLLTGCSAEAPPDATNRQLSALGVDAGGRDQQSPGAIPGQPALQAKSDPKSAGAKIMAGGFRPDGSFVHGDHIHKAGQENCPSEMNGGPVQ